MNGQPSPDNMEEENNDNVEDDGENENFLEIEDIDEVIDFPSNMDENLEEQESASDEEEELIIEQPIQDDSMLTLKKHNKAVFCASFHPEGKYCVSGGKDDVAHVWSLETGESLYQMDKFGDSVILASFSFDGKYLATADMAGYVEVRKCPHNEVYTWDMAWQTDTDDIQWGFWHPAAHVLIASTKDGNIYLWKIPCGTTKVLYSHGNQAMSGELFRDSKKMAVAYGDGCIKIWDLKTALPLQQIDSNDDSLSMNAIDTFHDNNLVVAGDISGHVYIIKFNTGKKVGVLNVQETPVVIKFSKDPTLGLVAIGTYEGEISIWDVARQSIRYKTSEDERNDTLGIRSLLWIDSYLLAACGNGTIKIIEAKSGNLHKILYGHTKEIFDMAYLQSKNLLLTSSEDRTCKIFKLDLPKV